jgi:hypothetical protein
VLIHPEFLGLMAYGIRDFGDAEKPTKGCGVTGHFKTGQGWALQNRQGCE